MVPVNNDKKFVTVVMAASLLSSQLLPPFVIDTEKFAADLMRQWLHYKRSTVLFNDTHWMIHYVFVLYLDWLLNMYPEQRTLLIVERATTHYGKMIDDWLEENHTSPLPGKIYIEYVQEGMTAIHQVCDVAVNKPVNSFIKIRTLSSTAKLSEAKWQNSKTATRLCGERPT